MRRAMVLGAAGFIGSALCTRLTGDGCEVHGVDHRLAQRPRPDCKFYSVTDLREDDNAMILHRDFDEIYQLAADVGGVAYLSGGHDADVMANNVAINRNVAQWAVGRCGVLVFTSSACVYTTQITEPLSEQDTFLDAPANDYGWEKLFSERLYQAHARDHGLNVRIARLGNVYGPGEPLSGPRAHMVGDLCRKALASAPSGRLEVWGDGSQIRSMVYVDDVVDGLIALARAPTDPGPVNIAGPPVCVADIARDIARASSGGSSLLFFSAGPTGAHSSALDVSKARAVLGWTAKTHLEDGLRATYEWAKAA